MKRLIGVLCCLFLCSAGFFGCASMRNISDGTLPQLLIQAPLPVIPDNLERPVFDLDIVLFIVEDGTIGKARMIEGSGNADWDSLALASMKQWRFSPARNNNQPVSTWYHMKTTIRYASPHYMNLAEILCTSADEADSVLKAVEEGKDFGDLAMKYSVDPSREMSGKLGEVNINLYPESIRTPISKLLVNSYTKPMKYGDLFVIFKRLPK